MTFSGTTSSDPDGGTLSYAWDLDGDGQYDDATTPTVARTYQVGVVTVGLRVTDSDSRAARRRSRSAFRTATRSRRSRPIRPPVRPPWPSACRAAGSSDPDGTALTYAWDLDDDGVFDDATGLTTSGTFVGVGPHSVTVRVQDADNGTATKSVTVTITNSGPVAAIVTNPVSGSGPAPLTVSFDGSTSQRP